MKTIAAASILFLALAGCVSQQELAQRQAEMSGLQSRLSAARQNTTVTCPNKQSCDKTFSLAKVTSTLGASSPIKRHTSVPSYYLKGNL